MEQVSSFLNLHLATFKILGLLEELLWIANTSKDRDPCRLCAVRPGISPFKCTLWVSSESKRAKCLLNNQGKYNLFLSFYSFLSLQLPTLFKISVSTLQGFVWLRLRNGSEGKVILSSPLQLKGLIRYLQGSFTICKLPPGRYQNIAQSTASQGVYMWTAILS